MGLVLEDQTFLVARIAQLIIERYMSPPITITTNIPETERAHKGFGSSGYNLRQSVRQKSNIDTSDEQNNISQHQSTRINSMRTTIHASQLEMNFHEPVYTTTVEVKNNRNFPLLGLELRNDDKGPIIMNCKQGSPTAKIHK